MRDTHVLVELAVQQKNSGYPTNDAYAEIVKRYQDLVFGYIFAIVKEYFTAQDVTQEVFIAAYRNLENLRNPHALPCWLKQIAKRDCIRVLKKKRKEGLPLETLEAYETSSMEAYDNLKVSEIQNEVYDAIKQLPDNQRIPVVMYYIQGYSQQNIAEFLEIEVNTVKKRLQRAREQLRREMTEMVKGNLEHLRPSKDNQLVEKVSLFITFDMVAKNGQIELLEQMLVDGIDINRKDATGRTLLHWAVESSHVEAVQLLIRSGADKHATDKNGKSALQLAEKAGNKEILEALVPDHCHE
ncbi:MAG: sigma-70 family RNA polymerase sigma factor [Clostridia bacterium]|nr:sigma-70 family RNA polymerase sigma factor [Clostridia bacterium]